jgi:hypothetical protein
LAPVNGSAGVDDPGPLLGMGNRTTAEYHSEEEEHLFASHGYTSPLIVIDFCISNAIA